MLNQTQVDTFREKGFLLGSSVLSDEQVEELRSELARVIDDYEKTDIPQPVHIANLGGKEESPVWQIVNIWAASPAYHRLVHNPVIVEEIRQLTSATELRVWHDQIQYKPPKVGGVNMWHQDSPYWPILTPKTSQVTAWVALDDVDEDNGCMRMVPSSYHWGNQIPFLRADHPRWRLPDPVVGEGGMSDQSTLLLEHHLKELKLPTVLREYGKLAAQCAAEGVSHPDYLLRLAELELTDRHQRMVQRRIRAARFPATKGLDTFDFSAIPSVNQPLVTQLARCEYVEHHENVIAIGNSGTGKTHVALGLGLAACQRGLSVGFTTAAALVNELMEARDERRLLNLQRQLARLRLLIIDELGFVPLSHTGAELLFEVFSQRYERGSILVTTNLPFDEWTEVFGSERLTGALLDRLTHHVHIIEMNGESYRLKGSRTNAATPAPDRPDVV